MFGDFLSGLDHTLEKKKRHLKFNNPLNLPSLKDNRLPPRTSKKPKKKKTKEATKFVELSRTDLPSSNRSVSAEKNKCTKIFSSLQGSGQSLSPRSPSPPNRKKIVPPTNHRDVKPQKAKVPPKLKLSSKPQIDDPKVKRQLKTTEKSNRPEVIVDRVSLGQLLTPKIEVTISTDSLQIPRDCTPYKESEAYEMGCESEIEYLFEGVHRNFFPKIRTPIESKALLETKHPIPRCYKTLLETFSHIELALFNLSSQNQRLTYKKVRDTIFHQTRG